MNLSACNLAAVLATAAVVLTTYVPRASSSSDFFALRPGCRLPLNRTLMLYPPGTPPIAQVLGDAFTVHGYGSGGVYPGGYISTPYQVRECVFMCDATESHESHVCVDAAVQCLHRRANSTTG